MQAGAVVEHSGLTSAACFPENCIFLTATTSLVMLFLACVGVCACEGRCVCMGREDERRSIAHMSVLDEMIKVCMMR